MKKAKVNFYVRYAQNTPVVFPGNFVGKVGCIYGRLNGKSAPIFWVCDNFFLTNGKLSVHIYTGEVWQTVKVGREHPCYRLVAEAVHKLGFIPQVQAKSAVKVRPGETEMLMRHSARHKKGSGSRINSHQINPVLRWNEVTEEAHWFAKGNASVVASNIR